MGERRGTKGLELWCKRITEGYPGVTISNMTTSWRDGLAFCAIIHHFKPELIDFSKLNKSNIYYNNELAFRVAEHHLGIPALLEPEDMVECTVPDRLSILTYLSQFYQAFAVNHSNSPIKSALKRPPPADLQMHMVAATSSSPPKKAALRLSGARRELCAKCGLPVFIAEVVNVGKATYHRTCFRCARCDRQLTLANYYETETNEFCCETCPDEEKSAQEILNRSLSDEEKSASLQAESDMYENAFETALEDKFHIRGNVSTRFMKERSEFMTTQVDSNRSETDSDSGNENKLNDLATSYFPETKQGASIKHVENIDADSNNVLPSFSDSGFPSFKSKDQPISNQTLFESQDPVTKDSISAKCKPASPLSSVKLRIKLFEGNDEKLRESCKSDVNRESLKLGMKVDEVPCEKTDQGHSVNPEQSLSVNTEKHDIEDTEIEDSNVRNLLNESAIPILKDEHELNKSAISEGYYADISDINDSVLRSEENESVIYISSDNSAEKNLASTSSLNEPLNPCDINECSEENESVIYISSDKSPEKSSVASASCISEELNRHNINESEVSDTSEKKLETKTGIEPLEELKICHEGDEKSSPVITYPDDLNPFGDEDEEPEAPKNSNAVSLNPFGDSDEDEEEVVEERAQTTCAESTNPFEDDDDNINEDVADLPPQPAVRKLIIPHKMSLPPYWNDDNKITADVAVRTPQPAVRKLISAPKISLTPYWNDDPKPVPKSRSLWSPQDGNSDTASLTGSGRKKKPAPKPPTSINQEANDSPLSSITSSPSQSVCHSPKPAAKIRKMKKAPLPPCSSTPSKPKNSDDGKSLADISPINPSTLIEDVQRKPLRFRIGSEENLKDAKDEINKSRQHIDSAMNEGPSSLPNKSTYGRWKRRKGQAPPRPIPQRRYVKSLPINEIKSQLELIEVQLLGLEKQGVRLEKLIRERTEAPGTNEDEPLAPEVEDMVLQLFELINEKNELSRKQAELMYLRRHHRLEEEQAEIEYQIRCLMLQPEANKTDSNKTREEELISRLIEIVDRRSEIVDCLEMERQRAVDEDTSISTQLSLLSLRRDEDQSTKKKKPGKKDKNKKDKEKKRKSKSKVDADKDIDESESKSVQGKKKKFGLF